MFIDAHSIPAGTLIQADICIVGGGAAGITVAREFEKSNLRVVLLESGGTEFDPSTQELYTGTSIGRPYDELATARLRYFGGTTNHWGGWCQPREPIDFEAREGVPHSGWPLARSDLDPWYRRAQEVLQLGPYEYSPARWGVAEDATPEPFKGPHFVCKMMQNSPPTRFGTVYAPELRQSTAVTVYLNANALRFDANDAGSEVQQVSVRTLAGGAFAVKARHYVLAAGGIENARLLLLSDGPGRNGLGNDRDLVGRYFMAHLIYSAGTIAVADPYTNFDFYTNTTSNGRLYEPFGHKFVSYIGLSEDALRRLHLPNLKIMWSFDYEPDIHAIRAIEQLIHRTGGDALNDLRTVIHDLGGAGRFAMRKALSRPAIPVRSLQLLCASEPLPNPDSRIRIGDQLDALGMRRVVIDWNLTADDKRGVLATQRLLGAEIGRTGFGRLRTAMDDSDTVWPDDMRADEHHMGTTRMHTDPAQGVVDVNCKLHSVANLYVGGSSVFPTAGSAHPTMTIVALALRLADHLKARLT